MKQLQLDLNAVLEEGATLAKRCMVLAGENASLRALAEQLQGQLDRIKPEAVKAE